MTGGLLQLVARGINDIYLIGDPQITLFKIVYRRHVNFSIYDDIIIPQHRGDFSSSTIIPIDRRGDLLGKLHLLVDVPNISIKRTSPTFGYIKKILNSYGIYWNYSEDDDNIVTLYHYNTDDDYDNLLSIKSTINDAIIKNIQLYNFYANAGILTENSDVIINEISNAIDRLSDNSDTLHDDTIIFIKGVARRNRFAGISTLYKIMLFYADIYDQNTQGNFITDNFYTVATNSEGTNFRDILLYTHNFEENITIHGMLVQLLSKYELDSLIYNATNDVATNAIDNSQSQPLFANILDRGMSPKSTILNFFLYTADDIRYLIYTTLLNNLTRIKVIQSGPIAFNPEYTAKLNGIDISLTASNIGLLGPDNTSFHESLLFYHVMDSDINLFSTYQYNIDTLIKTYFDDKIGTTYDTLLKYQHLIQFDRIPYTNVDSYKIYNLFMLDMMNDTANNKIKSSQHVDLVATTIKYNISNNIKYNFNILGNILKFLYKSLTTRQDHYIISFYKTYLNSYGDYVPINESFTPIVDNPSNVLADNFKKEILNVISLPVPTGINVKNYFNDHCKLYMKKFSESCNDYLHSVDYIQYMDNYLLWKRLSDTSLYNVYTAAVSGLGKPVPDVTVFEKVSLMNYIPLLVAKDIPKMVFNTF